MDSSAPNPTPSDINDILKKKRKIREHKACYPCRKRKVRCDSQIPCTTCMERNHADICTFNPPSKRQNTSNGQTANADDHLDDTNALPAMIEKDDWDRFCSKLSNIERNLADLRQDLRRVVTGASGSAATDDDGSTQHVKQERIVGDAAGPTYIRAMEINEQDRLTGENIHLGGASVPALVMALGKGGKQRRAIADMFNQDLLPIFGLDNETATYPFISLWGHQGAQARVNELCKALPNDAEALESFRLYREGAYITYPAVADIDKLEADLLIFLMNRRSGTNNDDDDEENHTMYAMSLQWVSLLFAAFASGAQFTTLPKKERDLVSQVYVCCSFECLRLVNYLSKASSEVIQTLLVLGNVLSNSMNAGVAWSFLGTTIRLGQSLGLHRVMDENKTPTPQDACRAKVWWAVLWQDSILSIPYDRASACVPVDCPFPPDERTDRGGRSYRESMYRVCKVGLDIVRNRLAPQSIEARLRRCKDLRDDVTQTQDKAATHLRDYRSCKSIRDQIEYWALALHASYIKSELCRPAVSPTTADFDRSRVLRQMCIDNLMRTVEAFLGLGNVSLVYTRPWATVHRALSSGLLLGILGEPLRNPDAHTLLEKLIAIMREVSAMTDGSELSAPVQRSISALTKLNAPESRTPRQMDESAIASAQGLLSLNSHNSHNGTTLAASEIHSVANNMVNSHASKNVKDSPGNSAFDINEANINLAFENSSFFLPSPLSGFEDESSPYALMDSILWGGMKPLT